MLLKKEGFPEEDELVLCTVTKIFHNGVFVDLDEYNKGGMIHISEVSPGRIRTLSDFVKEGTKITFQLKLLPHKKRPSPDSGHPRLCRVGSPPMVYISTRRSKKVLFISPT